METNHDENTAAPEAKAANPDERNWALFAHLAALLGYVFPFGGIIGPLVVWLLKKDEMPFVDEQGRESINFQITMLIAALICIPLVFIVIGVPLLFLVGIFDLIFVIVAAIKASEGTHYRYPIAIRLL